MASVSLSTVMAVAVATAVAVGLVAYALVRWRDRRAALTPSAGAGKQFFVRYQDPRRPG